MKTITLLLSGVLCLGLAGCDRHPGGILRGAGHAARGERQMGAGHGLKRECRDDLEQYCAADQTGRDRRQCLESHLDKLSAGCKSAVEARRNRHKNNGGGGDGDSE